MKAQTFDAVKFMRDTVAQARGVEQEIPFELVGSREILRKFLLLKIEYCIFRLQFSNTVCVPQVCCV